MYTKTYKLTIWVVSTAVLSVALLPHKQEISLTVTPFQLHPIQFSLSENTNPDIPLKKDYRRDKLWAIN